MKRDFVILSYSKNGEIFDGISDIPKENLSVKFIDLNEESYDVREGKIFVLLHNDEKNKEQIKKIAEDIMAYKVNMESLYVFIGEGVAIPIEWEFNPNIVIESNTQWQSKSFIDKIKNIFDFYIEEMKNQIEYEKLFDYEQLKSYEQVSLCAQKILSMFLKRMLYYGPRYNVLSNYLRQILLIFEKISANKANGYSELSKSVANDNLKMCKNIDKYIQDNIDSIIIREVHAAMCAQIYILMEIIDVESQYILSNGKIKEVPGNEYKEKITRLSNAVNKKEGKLPAELYFGNDLQIVEKVIETNKFYCKYIREDDLCKEPIVSEDDELLVSIANFIGEGNKIFSLISKKECNEEFLQSLEMSYKRLKSYCEIVGAKEVAEECVKRIYELKQIKEASVENSDVILKADKGIKALLGLKLPESGKFDAFISHKGADIEIATDVYNLLKKNLKTAFLDKVTLPELSETEYIKAIFQALDHSDHLIVVLSDIEYLNKEWLQYEMEAFLGEKLDGRKKEGNIIFVVTNDVYDKIMKDKTVLPLQFRNYEVMKIEDCNKSGKLISYIK